MRNQLSRFWQTWRSHLVQLGRTHNNASPQRARMLRTTLTIIVAIVMLFGLTACGGKQKAKVSSKLAGISEVSPPAEIQRLKRSLDQYQPQVSILSPRANQLVDGNSVSVNLAVVDLPVFKDKEYGLGPHLDLMVDNQTPIPVYDLSQPVKLQELSPGTHTIRVFASRPWFESFKNEGAYAQTTFHVYTPTAENTPDPQAPLLTFAQPSGTYGAEPVMLDFYIRNAPLHLAALDETETIDWQIRATINGQSFDLDSWRPIYLKGLQAGTNWLKLEFLDRQGKLIKNQFNSTAHLINYQSGGNATLDRLVRGEKIAGIDRIVNPDYVAPTPTPTPTPEPTPTPTPTPEPTATPTAKPTTTPTTTPTIEVKTTPTTQPSQAIPVVPVPVQEPSKAVAPKSDTKSEPKSESKPEAKTTPKPAPTSKSRFKSRSKAESKSKSRFKRQSKERDRQRARRSRRDRNKQASPTVRQTSKPTPASKSSPAQADQIKQTNQTKPSSESSSESSAKPESVGSPQATKTTTPATTAPKSNQNPTQPSPATAQPETLKPAQETSKSSKAPESKSSEAAKSASPATSKVKKKTNPFDFRGRLQRSRQRAKQRKSNFKSPNPAKSKASKPAQPVPESLAAPESDKLPETLTTPVN
ncbi:hypothetical protein Pse7367_0334 [Thalassoporum mexicanum PCC 7367]|uniref:hypothetical protein n=1 Tax=Thalassoporum mexicanum TaxID=3457544 RepID=UPI00029FB9C8|nr:hypothetical protein [Pseudanabaena sp. PCC 7367]AFY68645.1 hypothetical protein Pse7367_0334 [Pseudanabaena sp. PCC 7367]